jgi:hypothetical protein
MKIKPKLNRMVVDMPNANVAEDGSFSEMVLKNSDGSIQTIRFSPDAMMQFVARVFELGLFQKIQRESRSGLAEVQPLQVVTTMAQQDLHHKVVILQFRLQSGLPVAFAIQPSETEELYKQLGKAIQKVKTPLKTS